MLWKLSAPWIPLSFCSLPLSWHDSPAVGSGGCRGAPRCRHSPHSLSEHLETFLALSTLACFCRSSQAEGSTLIASFALWVGLWECLGLAMYITSEKKMGRVADYPHNYSLKYVGKQQLINIMNVWRMITFRLYFWKWAMNFGLVVSSFNCILNKSLSSFVAYCPHAHEEYL